MWIEYGYETMRREYGMSDREFWRELSLPRLSKLLELRGERLRAVRGGAGGRGAMDDMDAAAVAAGL